MSIKGIQGHITLVHVLTDGMCSTKYQKNTYKIHAIFSLNI